MYADGEIPLIRDTAAYSFNHCASLIERKVKSREENSYDYDRRFKRKKKRTTIFFISNNFYRISAQWINGAFDLPECEDPTDNN